MNLSGISNKNIFGKIIRFPLKLIPQKMIVPILQGELRGYRWIAGSSNHGCWLGSYEHEKQKLFSRLVKRGAVVFDLGAHAGFYSLLASRLAGASGKVYAFEPLPKNLENIHTHLKINNIANIEVVPAAVTQKSGKVYFTNDEINSSINRVSERGTLVVDAISLDDFSCKNQVLPDLIKIDIEGGEEDALRGAINLLKQSHPIILLATHAPEIHVNCCRILESLGYQVSSVNHKPVSETDEIVANYY